MVRDISGVGGPSSTEPRANNRNTNAVEEKGTSTTSERTVKEDSVKLSSEAKNLQSTADQVRDLPEVNESRVAEVKAALERNELNIDNQRLADKLLETDNLF